MKTPACLLAILFCLAAAGPACAWGWTNDPWTGFVSVCDAAGTQQFPRTCALADGNTLMAWADGRPGSQGEYYQVINAYGNPLLEVNGVPVIEATWAYGWGSSGQGIISDGQGGGLAIFNDLRNARNDIYGQRFDSQGNRLWGDTGLPLAVWLGHNLALKAAVADSSGNFFVSYQSAGSGGWSDLYAQKFDLNGQRLWGNYGVLVSDAPYDQEDPALVPDYQGGLLLVWQDSRNYQGIAYQNYTQHLDAQGNPLWTLNGLPLTAPGGGQTGGWELLGATDGQGGAIWAWNNSFLSFGYSYVERQNGNGQPVWFWYNGMWCGDSETSQMLRHPDGSYWQVTWENRSGTWGLYLYRFTVQGSFFWHTGIPYGGSQLTPTPGGVMTFKNYNYLQIFALNVDSSGTLLWQNWVACAPSPGYGVFVDFVTCPDGAGGAVVAIEDRLTSQTDHNISAQRVNADGSLGVPAKIKLQPGPLISSLSLNSQGYS